MFYTYMYTDPRTNVPFYVGKGKGNRAYVKHKENKQVCGYIQNLKKIGLRHIVEIAYTPTEKDAFWFEEDLISSLGRKDLGTGPLLNHTDGGDQPPSHLGKKRTPEQKKRYSESQKGNQNCLGRILSEETKEQIRQKHLGKELTSEHKEKLRDAHLGKKHSEEHKQKQRGHIPWNKGLSNQYTWRQDKIECPHCYRVGGKGSMKRYHFDNCKVKTRG